MAATQDDADLLAEGLAFFKTGTYLVTRTASGSYDPYGTWTPGAETALSIDAVVTNFTDWRELEAMAPGQVGKEVKRVRTKTEIKAKGPGFMGDKVQIGGEPWEVVAVKRIPFPGLPVYVAAVARLMVDE